MSRYCINIATNLKIDDALLAAATKIGGFSTKKDAVTEALKEFISRPKQQELKTLFGKVVYDDRYDLKKEHVRKR